MDVQLSRLGMVVLGSVIAVGCSTEGSSTRAAAADRPATLASPQQVNADAKLLADFKSRIDNYMELHNRLEKQAPPLKETKDPAQIKASQDGLAQKIREARKDAKPGDIFTPEIRQLFRRLMYPETKGTDGAETKAAIAEEKHELKDVQDQGERGISRRRSAHDGAAQHPRGTAEAARGPRIPVREQAHDPARRAREPDRRLRVERDSVGHDGAMSTGADRGRSTCGASLLQSSSRWSVSFPLSVQERLQLPNKEGSIKFLVIGDSGTGGSDQLRVANRIAEVRKIFPFEFAIMVGDNMYGGEGAERLPAQVRGALQAAARRRREVLCRARQPRRSDAALLQELQHERRALLHVQGAQARSRRARRRTVLRARQQLHVAGTGGLAREGAEGERLGLEDPLLPSPALLVGREARRRLGAARAARAAVREIRRRRGLRRPRALLRTAQAAEGDHLLRQRQLGQAAQGQHRPAPA